MRVLLTGANGYIGTRLLSLLIEKGHEVIALVRSKERFNPPEAYKKATKVIEGDLLLEQTLTRFPEEVDAAYYLVHSMSDDPELFMARDRIAALNFLDAIQKTRCKQIIYLSGLVGDAELSEHLASRLEVEKILRRGSIPVTTLRTSIIIGSGSASFEIIHDLIEKLPVLTAPKWVNQKCQPIAIADILDYLICVLGDERCMNRAFDVGGPEVLSYKQMLKSFAKLRRLKRLIITLPFFSPRLSSYWLIFITSTNYYLARGLIASLKNNSVCHENSIQELFPKNCLTYEEAVKRAFEKIRQNAVVSSWRDAWTASDLPPHYLDYIQVPKFGCLSDSYSFAFEGDPTPVMHEVFRLGGHRGYYMNWAWQIRGRIDRYMGGVGLERGKTERKKPRPGDAIDFWRVLLADEKKRRFLLYSEMRLPGEAWLEHKIALIEEQWKLIITATFRPKGVFGRLYWFALLPMHKIIFNGMGKKIIKKALAK